MTNVKLPPSWLSVLQDEFTKPYFQKLTGFVKKEYLSTTIYPHGKNIFRAFELCPFDQIKVVILGQDPYHGPDQANGLCFSVNEGIHQPPSLQNIFKEIATDLNLPIPASGNLDHWASQGILLLNATLTVRANQAGSHQRQGWEEFTDRVIQTISDQKDHIVFLLWGKYAQEKGKIIDQTKHLVLSAAHPSPFSAFHGFFGCRHFSKTNAYLHQHGLVEINWTPSTQT